jgi:capsule polysaccharide export protein KpsE/RkpR
LIISNQIPPIVQIDNNKAAVIEIMKSRIKLEIKDRNLTVTTKMPNPFQSAIVGKIALENLLKFITAFKTHKQISQILYLQERVIESEERYKIAQKRFAGYKDNSLGIIIQSAQTNEQVLNNELSVAFNIYNQFSVQLEQAKIELKKETPYFSILEPISIPNAAIEPSITYFFIKYLLIFILISLSIIVYKLFFNL